MYYVTHFHFEFPIMIMEMVQKCIEIEILKRDFVYHLVRFEFLMLFGHGSAVAINCPFQKVLINFIYFV